MALVALACGPRTAGRIATSSSPAQVSTLGPASAAPATVSPPPFPGACVGARCFETSDGFRHLHPLPQGLTLEGVVAIAPGEALAVGANATVLYAGRGRVHPVAVPGVRSLREILAEVDGGLGEGGPGAELRLPRIEHVTRTGPAEITLLLDRGRLARFTAGVWSTEGPPPLATFGDQLYGSASGVTIVTPDLLASLVGGGPAPLQRVRGQWTRGGALPKRTPIRSGIVQGDRVWLGGDHGAILRSDAGAAFVAEPVAPKATQDIVALWVSPTGTRGFAATRGGEIYERSGQGWRSTPSVDGDRPSSFDVVALWGSPSGDDVWAAGSRLFHKKGDGPWEPVPLPPYMTAHHAEVDLLEGLRFHAIDGTAADDVWFVGRGGLLLHWDGATLRDLGRHETEAAFKGILPTGADRFLAVAGDGTVLAGTGTEITPAPGISGRVESAVRASDGALVAMRSSNELFVHEEGVWSPRPARRGLYRLHAAESADVLFGLGSDGKLFRSDPTKTETIAVPTKNDLAAMTIAAPRDIWIVGGDVVLRGDGTRFSVASQQAGDEYRCIAARGEGDVWIGGSSRDGFGVAVHWNGGTFERHERVHDDRLLGIAVGTNGHVWGVGFRGAATHFDGKTWAALSTRAGSLEIVQALGDGTVIVGGRDGTLLARTGSPRNR